MLPPSLPRLALSVQFLLATGVCYVKTCTAVVPDHQNLKYHLIIIMFKGLYTFETMKHLEIKSGHKFLCRKTVFNICKSSAAMTSCNLVALSRCTQNSINLDFLDFIDFVTKTLCWVLQISAMTSCGCNTEPVYTVPH